MLRPVACVAPIVAIMASAFAHPPVFSDVSFADAKKANATNGKYLLIKGTAVWCGPCKKMDKTTWVDDQVVAWVKANGVAIALDVDEHPDDAQSLKIEAMPTMIIMKEGKELDRIVGYRDAEQLLAWVKDVEAGKTTAARVKEKAGKRANADGSVDIQARLELAREAMQSGQLEIAKDEYVWLWDNMVEFNPGYGAVRVSFMVRDMQMLAQRHKPALEAFTIKRDELEAKLKAKQARMSTLQDWVALNQVVGDDDRTLAWFDRIKDEEGAEGSFNRVRAQLEELLESRQRWKDLGRVADMRVLRQLMHDPLEHWTPPSMTEEQIKEYREYSVQAKRAQAARSHAWLLAANRTDDAAEMARIALAKQDTPAMRRELVKEAIAINVATRSMHAWLDEADKADADGKATSDELRSKLPAE